MNSNEERKYSFINKGWDNSITASVDKLSEAGFYYTGLNDVVECFHCTLRLRVKDNRDEPLITHTKFSSNCFFLKFYNFDNFFTLSKYFSKMKFKANEKI